MSSGWLIAALAAPWLGAIVVVASSKIARRWLGKLALVSIVLSAVCVGLLMPAAGSSDHPFFDLTWIASMGVHFRLELDALAVPFVINILGVSFLSIVYAWDYAADHHDLGLYYGLLLAFAGSMLGSVLATDALLFFVFWELMLIASAILIASWGEGDRVEQITLKYFLYTQAGSMLILAALLTLISRAGSSNLTQMAQAAANMPPQTQLTLMMLMLVGFGVKMAVFPLHAWLPDAHSIASMPVTIMLAAAMLAMGAYGLLRFSLMMLGPQVWDLIQFPLMLLAFISQVYGALMSLASEDIKRIIAYSSVSQLGYILFGIASLTIRGADGAVIHVLTHGLLKAALFMAVGVIMRGTGRRRIGEINGLYGVMPGTALSVTLAALAITGMPPFCAFHDEWQLLVGGMTTNQPVLGYLELLAPLATTMYAIAFALRLVLGSYDGDDPKEAPRSMRWSLYATVALSTLLGLWPAPLYAWAEGAVALLGLGG